jgi:hypothetical protein
MSLTFAGEAERADETIAGDSPETDDEELALIEVQLVLFNAPDPEIPF